MKKKGDKVMYEFVIERFDILNDDECSIYPIQQESPLTLEEAMKKVLDFASGHPNGILVKGNGRLVEYEVDGAELCCYVDYQE